MSSHWGMPGPGGSLGKCAVCGDGFITAILTGEGCQSFTMGCFDETLYAHSPKCIDALKAALVDGQVDPTKLPEGPLREALKDLPPKEPPDAA